jgi:drug/metabolite transporter (DMT)-like permease
MSTSRVDEHVAPSSSPLGVGAAIAAVTAWGFGNTVIASVPLPGTAVAFWRLTFAVALYVPLLHLRGGRLSWRSFRAGWRGGVAFGVDIAAFFVAIHLTTVANATTINALQPLVIMGFAAVMFGERIRSRHVVCAVTATVGVALVAFGAASSGTGSLAGDLMAVVALFCWAWYFIESKSARTRLDTFEYMTVMNIVALLVVAPIALFTGSLTGSGEGLSAGTALTILLIVLIPGSGHILINWAHGHTTLVLTSLITLGMPVLSTLSAAVFLDQQVVAVQVAGIVVVLASLAVVIVGDARASPAPPTVEATEPAP